jgi:hypothetical protein
MLTKNAGSTPYELFSPALPAGYIAEADRDSDLLPEV